MLNSWSPLFSSIVQSSLWESALHVRIVFITMIALKDRQGFVKNTIPGLKRAAAVSMPQVLDALNVLLSKDEFSDDKSNDGRRIEAVPGGWMVFGHEKYQKLMHEVSNKVNNAKRQADFRARHKPSNNVSPSPGEIEHIRMENAGASQAQLDAHVNDHLPPAAQ